MSTARRAGLRLAPAWILIVASFAAAVGAQVWRDRQTPPPAPIERVLYLPDGGVVERLALSFDAILADVYWVRTVLHFGGVRRGDGPKRYELLQPLLDITTTLDPLFTVAYRYGAIFLAEPPPGGPGRPDDAIALLEKGLEASPGRWRYLQDIGFVKYWWKRDYEGAARAFKQASDVEGAPWWLSSMAAVTLAEGGDRRASRRLWLSLLENTEDDWLKQDAVRRLRQLDALDQIDQLEEIVAQYLATSPPTPYTWEDLIAAGALRAIPRDPDGVPYYLGPYTGRVDLGDESRLQPLPVEPLEARPMPST